MSLPRKIYVRTSTRVISPRPTYLEFRREDGLLRGVVRRERLHAEALVVRGGLLHGARGVEAALVGEHWHAVDDAVAAALASGGMAVDTSVGMTVDIAVSMTVDTSVDNAIGKTIANAVDGTATVSATATPRAVDFAAVVPHGTAVGHAVGHAVRESLGAAGRLEGLVVLRERAEALQDGAVARAAAKVSFRGKIHQSPSFPAK